MFAELFDADTLRSNVYVPPVNATEMSAPGPDADCAATGATQPVPPTFDARIRPPYVTTLDDLTRTHISIENGRLEPVLYDPVVNDPTATELNVGEIVNVEAVPEFVSEAVNMTT